MTAARVPNSVVVVGGGIAGVSACDALRANGYDGGLTMIDAGDKPYDRPPLSKEFLTGATSFDDLALKPDAWFDDHQVQLMAKTEVAGLLPGESSVQLADGSLIRADRVVLATGGRPMVPPLLGVDQELVHTLRTAEDAQRLKTVLTPGVRLLVVGAGLIGAEVASTAVDLGCEVTMVDPIDPPLAGVVGPDVAAWMHDEHTRRGITVRQAGVESVAARPGGVRVALTGGHEPADFDVVLLAVGMTPAIELARTAGLECDGGIIVDRGQTTGNAAVLAIGDPSRRRLPDGHTAPRSEHWEAAEHDANRAAATILGRRQPADQVSWFWTDRHGHHIEVVGKMGDAHEVVHRGAIGDQQFSVLGLRDGYVVSAVAVDSTMVVRAARRMIDRQIRVDPLALADTSVDPRKLVRH